MFLISISYLLAPPTANRTHVDRDARLCQKLVNRDGQTYNVISAKWWRTWKEYSGFKEDSDEGGGGTGSGRRGSDPRRRGDRSDGDGSDEEEFEEARGGAKLGPGPINNSDLCIDGFPEPAELRRELNEHEDYALIPGAVYELLVGWYGGGPSLERKLVENRRSNSYSIDLFPLRIEVVKAVAKTGAEPPGVGWSSGSNFGEKQHQVMAGVTTKTAQAQAVVYPEMLHFQHNTYLDDFYDDLIRHMVPNQDKRLGRLWAKLGESFGSGSGGVVHNNINPLTEGDGDGWILLEELSRQNGTMRLDECFQDIDVVQVLVEIRKSVNASFPRAVGGGHGGGIMRGEDGGESKVDPGGAFGEEVGTPLADPRWRKALRVGSLLDALDSDNQWFDARIVHAGEGGDEGMLVRGSYCLL